MKKLWFLVGIGMGFLLGSRAGSGPYDQIQATVRSVRSRPEVQDTVDTVRSAAHQKADDLVHQVGEHRPGTDDRSEDGAEAERAPR